MFLNPVSRDEVVGVIADLGNRVAPGQDGISTQNLKLLSAIDDCHYKVFESFLGC